MMFCIYFDGCRCFYGLTCLGQVFQGLLRSHQVLERKIDFFQKHDHLFLNCLEFYEILCDQSSSQRPTCLETWAQFQPMATSSLLARWGNNCSSMKYLDFFIKKDKMMIFFNRLLQFLCLQVKSALSRSFFYEPFRKQL